MPVTLTAYSRLHLGLLDTAGVSRRIFGGAGFSLADRPRSFTRNQHGDTPSRGYTSHPEGECLRAFAALYHSIVPAVANGDLALLHCGLAEFQALGLKKAEIAGQDRSVGALLGTLDAAGVAAGMSSLGPLVFAIHGRPDGAARVAVQEAAVRHGAEIIATCGVRNFGHLIDGRTVTRAPLRSVA